MPGSEHISELMRAEEQAQAIVAQARQDKLERLRAAKTEAHGEIERFRADQEAAYKQSLEDGSSSGAGTLARLQAETEQAIAAEKQNLAAKKDSVAAKLAAHVLSV